MIINSLESDGMISVSTKDPQSQLFRQKMEEYLEDTQRKVGPRKRGTIIITLKMIELGYFLLTINAN